jgi:hypothetical protein
MTIFCVQVTVHDGEHEYPFYEYVNTTSPEKARASVVKLYGFNKQSKNFKVIDHDVDGMATQWEEQVGYRIYEIESVAPAMLHIDGITQTVDLSELMGRPVLPLFSKDTDWLWQKDNDVAYWWYMGDMVVEVLKLFHKISDNDSHISILYWSYFDLNKQAKAKEESGWKLTKGEIDG